MGFGFKPKPIERITDGAKVEIEGRLLIDSNSGTKFLSFFIPHSSLALEACVILAKRYNEVVPLNGMYIESHAPGTAPVSSAQYPFSRKIFVYHDDIFTPEQTGDIYRLFKQEKLQLDLRGPDYAEAEMNRREAIRKHSGAK
jgi:hypothetical protein